MCSYSSRMFKVKMERSDSCVMSTGVEEVAHRSGAFGTRGNLDLGPMIPVFRYGGQHPLELYFSLICFKFAHGNVGPGRRMNDQGN